MSAYRTPAPPDPRPAAARGSHALEEALVGLVWVVVGAIPVGLALAHRRAFGLEASLGAMGVVLGVACLLHAWRVSRAVARPRPRDTARELRRWMRSS